MYGLSTLPQPSKVQLLVLEVTSPASDWQHDSVLVGSHWDVEAEDAAPTAAAITAVAPPAVLPSAAAGATVDTRGAKLFADACPTSCSTTRVVLLVYLLAANSALLF